MDLHATITLGIAIAGFIGGIIVGIVKVGLKTGEVMEKLKTNEQRDTEERQKTSAKFSELYNRVSATEGEVNALQTSVGNLVATCSRIENKLDRIIERG